MVLSVVRLVPSCTYVVHTSLLEVAASSGRVHQDATSVAAMGKPPVEPYSQIIIPDESRVIKVNFNIELNIVIVL